MRAKVQEIGETVDDVLCILGAVVVEPFEFVAHILCTLFWCAAVHGVRSFPISKALASFCEYRLPVVPSR